MWLQKIFIPSVLQGLHSGKKAQKMQQCTCVRVIFYFSKECRKEYIPPFIYYIFTKSCNFFVMSFAYFSKVLTFYRRIIAKQYVEKKDISKKKKSMALTFAYLPASKPTVFPHIVAAATILFWLPKSLKFSYSFLFNFCLM